MSLVRKAWVAVGIVLAVYVGVFLLLMLIGGPR